jgi:hypothetical protein
MVDACSTHWTEVYTKFWLENLREGYHLENLDLHERLISKRILKK